MFVNAAVRTVARASSKRPMSTASPKMHKAKDVWGELKATRPPEGHPHTVFEPPYNPVVVGCAIAGVITTGYGLMYFGMRHQQYKQGYWK